MERDWHERRRRGIGGSDVAAILGLSPWKTPLQVYKEKVGEAQPDERETEEMRFGKLLEPVVRAEYERRSGKVVVPSVDAVSTEHPFMVGNLDGLIPADNGGFEAKTAGYPTGWGQPGTDEIPSVYICQVFHYLVLRKLSYYDVAALFGGNDFRTYTVLPDADMERALIEKERVFWQEHVERRIPPPPINLDDLGILHPEHIAGKIVENDENMATLVQAYREADALAEEWENKKATARFNLLTRLADAEGVKHNGQMLCTYKSQSRTNVDMKALLEDHPEVRALTPKYTRSSRFRVLRLKEPKGVKDAKE